MINNYIYYVHPLLNCVFVYPVVWKKSGKVEAVKLETLVKL